MALLGYALGVAGLLVARQRPPEACPTGSHGVDIRLPGVSRTDVYCAFQFYHGWSHASAFEETARQTQETVGWGVGEGLFVSYFFTVAWSADAIWWWLADAENYASRPRALIIALHAFFFFIVFNATVVFESGGVRWLGLALCGRTNSSLVDQRHREGVLRDTSFDS